MHRLFVMENFMFDKRTILKNITWLQTSIATNVQDAILGIFSSPVSWQLQLRSVRISRGGEHVFRPFSDFGYSELMVREGRGIRPKSNPI
jgi:hypothetical protein